MGCSIISGKLVDDPNVYFIVGTAKVIPSESKKKKKLNYIQNNNPLFHVHYPFFLKLNLLLDVFLYSVWTR